MAIRPLQSVARHGLAPLSTVGRYSIWIYLIHQPVCMLICMLVFGYV